MVASSDFVHLHVHGECSLLDGFGKNREYLDRIEHIGQKAMGSSDHGNVFGVYQLIKEANARGVTPVPECEFYMAPLNPEGAKVQGPVFYGPNGQKVAGHDVASNGAYTHQTIWAVNNVGLQNLFKLSSLSFDPERNYSKPRIDFELLAEHSEGLVVATGCPSSEISTRFRLGQDAKAYEYANRLKEVFGDRLFVEIMDHDMSIPLERLLLPKQLELSRKMNIPLLATNDAHYTVQAEHVHHEEMLCSQSGAVMSDPVFDDGGNRFAFNDNQFYLKTAEEMANVFSPEDFPGALSNTLLVAEMAKEINLSYDPTLKPRAIIPAKFKSDIEYFDYLVEEGFEKRYGNAPREIKAEARKRISNERPVIYSSDFIGYFLVVHEYMTWSRNTYATRDDQGDILALPVGVGRGSVGGSIIAYLLYISELDPIKHDLLFERFLSAGRGDTYEITYDDGTSETIIVSEEKTVAGEQKYIHQLKVGDEVEFVPEPAAVDSSLTVMDDNFVETPDLSEVTAQAAATAVVAPPVPPVRVAITSAPAASDLTNLDNIPF